MSDNGRKILLEWLDDCQGHIEHLFHCERHLHERLRGALIDCETRNKKQYPQITELQFHPG